jgi:LacI family transcriptional regulator
LVSADSTEVLTADADSESGAHGSRSPWLAFAGRHSGEWTSVVLVQDAGQDSAADPRPWFVRVADYVGAGPALAWDTPCVIGAGEDLHLGLVALVVDRRLSTQDASDLADLALARVATARRGAS